MLRRILVGVAVIAVGVALLYPFQQSRVLLWLFGPEAVEANETFSKTGATFDHQLFEGVLRAHISPEGWVDYPGLAAAPDALDAYLDQLAGADVEGLARDEALALLINAYNAFTLKLMIENWPLQSIKDIPAAKRWKAERWRLGGATLSLDALEHQWLRRRFVEPRIHFAINCASVGCPPLRAEAYTGARIEAQLADQAARVNRPGSRWLRLEGDTVWLSSLYLWFESDFTRDGRSALDVAVSSSPELAAAIVGRRMAVEWLPYDWAVNIQP